ncbi:MAG TPA: phytanoyl-CoA dioxygenase family protein [Candidatus Dormibacteraeota bacterium]
MARFARDIRRWDRDGFAILPRYISVADLALGRAELHRMFPTADDFHDRVDEDRSARFRDEFGGITNFPFAGAQLSLLSVHPQLIDLAEILLGTTQLRVYAIEAWAKYTGAADYDQPHHRDYLNHTLLVPAPDQPPQQVEMFLFLSDVPDDLGPTSFVPRPFTQQLPALPNWYPRADGVEDADQPDWVASTGRPDLYEVEVSGAGPEGTVVAYRIETFHRATDLVQPRGARYTLHVNFRSASADWVTRRAWTDTANTPAWQQFVREASPRQLELFGFPPRGHPYWTAETFAGMALRYPGLDLTPWQL